MRRRIKYGGGLLAFLLALHLQASPAAAISVLGIDTGRFWDYNIVSFLSGVSFTEVSTANFATTNLNLYDVLFVSDNALQATFDALNARESDISGWLGAGHGVVALAFAASGTHNQYDWLPDAIQPTVGGGNSDSIGILNPAHPVMAGLTDAGLSGWSVSSHGSFTNAAGLEELASQSNNPLPHSPVIIAGSFGLGRVVLTTMDADEHHTVGVVKTDQVTLVQNAIDWTDFHPDSVAAPEPASLLLLGSGLAGLGLWRWKRRARSMVNTLHSLSLGGWAHDPSLPYPPLQSSSSRN